MAACSGKSPDVARSTLKLGAITILFAAVSLSWSGDSQARIMVEQQPMKMARQRRSMKLRRPVQHLHHWHIGRFATVVCPRYSARALAASHSHPQR